MRRLTLTLFVLLVVAVVNAQTDTAKIREAVQRCADSMTLAFKNRDWKGLAHFTLPAVVNMIGGEESFVRLTETAMKEVPADALKEFSIGPLLQLVRAGAEWQCVIEQKIKLEIEGTPYESITSLVGQSDESGQQWKFADSKGNRQTALIVLPSLSNRLVIPKASKVFDSNPPLEKTKKSPAPPTRKTAPRKPVQKAKSTTTNYWQIIFAPF